MEGHNFYKKWLSCYSIGSLLFMLLMFFMYNFKTLILDHADISSFNPIVVVILILMFVFVISLLYCMVLKYLYGCFEIIWLIIGMISAIIGIIFTLCLKLSVLIFLGIIMLIMKILVSSNSIQEQYIAVIIIQTPFYIMGFLTSLGICFMFLKEQRKNIIYYKCILLCSIVGLIVCFIMNMLGYNSMNIKNIIEMHPFYFLLYTSVLVSYTITKYAFKNMSMLREA